MDAEAGDGEEEDGQYEGHPTPAEGPRGVGERLGGRPGGLQRQRPLPPGDGRPVHEPGHGERCGEQKRERGGPGERGDAVLDGEGEHGEREPADGEPRLPPHPVQRQYENDGHREPCPVAPARLGGRTGGHGPGRHLPRDGDGQREDGEQRMRPTRGHGIEPTTDVGGPPLGSPGRYVLRGQRHGLSGHPRIMTGPGGLSAFASDDREVRLPAQGPYAQGAVLLPELTEGLLAVTPGEPSP